MMLETSRTLWFVRGLLAQKEDVESVLAEYYEQAWDRGRVKDSERDTVAETRAPQAQ